ncbi:MAG: hypothetical protein QOH70_2263 [Blastocatellia bacterium]|jgi:hypothetical protein|nr:hypothetical protein [Blastocatellia bacterium]
MDFELLSDITEIEPIAVGSRIRDIAKLRRKHGRGRWRKLKGVATIRLRNGHVRVAELHWYEAHGIGRKDMKQTKKPALRFVVCIDNKDYPASLELHKIYRVLPDEDAAADGDLRVIDESGEDYLYSGERFVPIALPEAVQKSLLKAA